MNGTRVSAMEKGEVLQNVAVLMEALDMRVMVGEGGGAVYSTSLYAAFVRISGSRHGSLCPMLLFF